MATHQPRQLYERLISGRNKGSLERASWTSQLSSRGETAQSAVLACLRSIGRHGLSTPYSVLHTAEYGADGDRRHGGSADCNLRTRSGRAPACAIRKQR